MWIVEGGISPGRCSYYISKAFLNVRSSSSETFVRRLQYKILNDIVFTNNRLAKIGYVPNDLCTFCGI